MKQLRKRSLLSLLVLLLAIGATACSDDSPNKPSDAGPDTGDGPSGDSGPVPAHCNPLDPTHCALPWPSSFYLKEDTTTPTGFRVNYTAEALPISGKGKMLDVSAWNRKDGFSPSVQPVAYFDKGVSGDGLVGENDDYGKSLEATALVQIIDFTSGERVPLFAEVEQQALQAGFKDKYKPGLLIRPAKRLLENRRYVVVLRVGIKAHDGSALAPPEPFRKIRDGETTGDPTIDKEATRLEPVLKFAEGKGIARKDMLLVWDFHTASAEAVRGDVLFMVDDALARMQQNGGPDFKIIESKDKSQTHLYREITGTISVPSYLATDDNGSWLKRDASGKPEYRGQQDFHFRLHIPACAETAQKPLRVLVYGHGLFGSVDSSLNDEDTRADADRFCVVLMGVDWLGLSNNDTADAVTMITQDWAKFPRVTDRLHQAQVNFAALVELAAGSKLWAATELQVNGTPVADGKEIYYFGISGGGINGFVFTALQKRIEKFVLQVPGGPWTLLMQRSARFLPFVGLLLVEYQDPIDLALLIHLSQQFWDPVDPASYAPHILQNPLPGRSAKKVIVQEALNDPAVNNLGTRYLVRSMGTMPQMTPAHVPLYGVEQKAAPLDSAYLQWDLQQSWRHPGGNLTPKTEPPGPENPHTLLGKTESCRLQLDRFYKADGKAEQTCTAACNKDNAITP
ncbi:MAG: hypothetical protein KC503_02575 [Myxococcales bacterium]|nr:hypothetical protein [Myxococcales bacterium]